MFIGSFAHSLWMQHINKDRKPATKTKSVFGAGVFKMLLITKTQGKTLYQLQDYLAYFVPNKRSPASPNPGNIYPFSFNCLSCVDT